MHIRMKQDKPDETWTKKEASNLAAVCEHECDTESSHAKSQIPTERKRSWGGAANHILQV
jgi:hypothetical protein